jgi:hypothetical protein
MQLVKWHPKQPDRPAVASESSIDLLTIMDADPAYKGAPVAQSELPHVGAVFTMPTPLVVFDFASTTSRSGPSARTAHSRSGASGTSSCSGRTRSGATTCRRPSCSSTAAPSSAAGTGPCSSCCRSCRARCSQPCASPCRTPPPSRARLAAPTTPCMKTPLDRNKYGQEATQALARLLRAHAGGCCARLY